MIKLKEHKHLTGGLPIERFAPPKIAYIPLSQHLGKACIPQVRVGDQVSPGQKIASCQAHVFAPIHASISGKVTGLRDYPHPLLGRCKAIVIDGDGEDRQATDHPSASLPSFSSGLRGTSRAQTEIDKLSPEDIRGIVGDAGIVGMGGAGFPTHIKLKPPKPVDSLIINGAECEPYLTADYCLMLEKTSEIISAVGLIVRCLGVKQVYIAIEDNKPEAIKAFQSKIQDIPLLGSTSLTTSRSGEAGYEIRILKSMYPQGGERQLIKNILGREVPSGKLPFDVGVVVHNVATIFAVYEAVYLNKPLYERVVTVTGSCLSTHKNILARIGTPIKELIGHCGPLKDQPAKIVVGGPMMGIAQCTDAVPVIKTTSGIILLNKREAALNEEEACIRCGACIRECPAGLMPCLLNLACEKELWAQTKDDSVLDCIECGVCNYVCPANRNLVQSIKRAKLEAVR
ncbi:electron transport complex subunit RsxC [Candidatus Omnitrophota bacterium]